MANKDLSQLTELANLLDTDLGHVQESAGPTDKYFQFLTLFSYVLTKWKAIYDSGDVGANVYARSNHSGTQLAATISDFATQVNALADIAITDASAGFFKLGINEATDVGCSPPISGHVDVRQALIDAFARIVANETAVAGLDQAIVLKGTWDASLGTFPGAGSAQAGWKYIVSVAGTVDGVTFGIGDTLTAILDNASTATYTSNWFKADNTEAVFSVAGKVGPVTLDADDVSETGGKKWLTNTEQTKLASIEDSADVTDSVNVDAALDTLGTVDNRPNESSHDINSDLSIDLSDAKTITLTTLTANREVSDLVNFKAGRETILIIPTGGFDFTFHADILSAATVNGAAHDEGTIRVSIACLDESPESYIITYLDDDTTLADDATISGTSHTLGLADVNRVNATTNGAAVTIAVPTDATTHFPLNAEIYIQQRGAGQVEVTFDAGATVYGESDGAGDYKISVQYGTLWLKNCGANIWMIAGRLATA